ncbi:MULTISPECIES: WD40 repeat domain-containing serine/threonine protein kinase [unclassified Nocardia]|uniref:WD40 repeat domain-containing serine/threonine protein kinase n=1 Tax=unclassified Nocardia TaxID=2637762 RepID=UPI001CE43B09|nr:MULTISPECIES: serine/threonine-protein kinase [unclassified Nocardia]
MLLQPGVNFAGYTIARLLGTGGMGAVYLARHPRLERLVALKILNDACATDPKARAAFEREANLAARLEHPNIVPIYDCAGADDPALWLSMRYIDGGDVNALLAAHPGGLPTELVVRLLTDAADALDFAHRHGVVHRDVKPANLLIEHDSRGGERVVLTDFGIARTLDDTTTSGLKATVAYAAPERFRDGVTDHRADIYSLGCTLFQLLTGEKPFPRGDHAAVISAHLSDPPPRPSARRPELPPGLDPVLAIAMAKEPEERYQSCADLVDAVRAATTSAQSRAVVRDEAAEPRTGGLRRRAVLGGAIALPVAAAVGGLVALRLSGNTSEKAATPEAVLTGHTGAVNSVAFSNNGALIASGSSDLRVQLWNVRSRMADGQPFTGHFSAVSSVAFSPDGALLASGGAHDGSVRFWNLRSRRADGAAIMGLADDLVLAGFGRDPAVLAAVDQNGVHLLNVVARQNDTPALPRSGGHARTGAASPDGRRVAADDGNAILLWDTGNREVDGLPLTGLTGKVTALAFDRTGALLAASSRANEVLTWKVHTRQPDGPAMSCAGTVNPVEFSPDGSLLATTGRADSIVLWNLRTRRPSGRPLDGHTDRVSSLSFNPDGSLLASGSEDRTVRLWRLARS